MIGIDTNILLRYLTRDDLQQLARVRELFETGEQLFICDAVLVEAVWVLQRPYRLPKADVIHAIETVVENEVFAFDDPPVVIAALADYRVGRGDFSDYLIGRRNAAAGCEHTVTFDKDLAPHPAFILL